MKAKKKGNLPIPIVLLCGIIVLAAVIAFASIGKTNRANGSIGNESIGQIVISSTGGAYQIVNVYLAYTPQQQTTGLMYVTSMGNCRGLGNCYGMLFVFPNTSNQCFWMENTEIPLKQSWIISNVITNQVNATPYSKNTYCYEGDAVLETYPNSTLTVGSYVSLQKVVKS